MDSKSVSRSVESTTLGLQNEAFTKNPSDEQNATTLYAILIPTFGAIIIVSNLAVVISSALVLIKRKQPTTIYLLLGNIGLAGLLTGIVVVFGQAFPINLKNQQICAIEIGIVVTSTIVIIISIGTIAIDRFLYILYGLYYKRWIGIKIIIGMTIFSWIIGGAVGFLPIMGWSRNTTSKECWFILIAPKNLVLTIAAIYITPITLVVFLFSVILFRGLQTVKIEFPFNKHQSPIKPKAKKFTALRGRTPPQLNIEEHPTGFFAKIFEKKFSNSITLTERWKSIKVVNSTTISFMCTWFPYMVVCWHYMNVCEDNNDNKKCKDLSLILASPLAMLGFVNGLVNPIIYAWWHKGFDRFWKRRMSTFRSKTASREKKVVPSVNSNSTINTVLHGSANGIANV